MNVCVVPLSCHEHVYLSFVRQPMYVCECVLAAVDVNFENARMCIEINRGKGETHINIINNEWRWRCNIFIPFFSHSFHKPKLIFYVRRTECEKQLRTWMRNRCMCAVLNKLKAECWPCYPLLTFTKSIRANRWLQNKQDWWIIIKERVHFDNHLSDASTIVIIYLLQKSPSARLDAY